MILSMAIMGFLLNVFPIMTASDPPGIHVWERIELTLEASGEYDNYYTDVTCWVDLEGPDFSKKDLRLLGRRVCF